MKPFTRPRDDDLADNVEGELDAVGEPAPRVHRGNVDAKVNDGARDLRADTRQDRLRTQEPHCRRRLEEVASDLRVDEAHARDIEDDGTGPIFSDANEHRSP